MHSLAIVVTKDKPSEEVLAAVLAPFNSEAGESARWDWWTLGGRFTGILIPHDVADTVVADPHPLAEAGPGVDALQHRNLKALEDGRKPFVVVIDGHWHQCEIFPIEAQVRLLCGDDAADRRDFSEERAAVAAWNEKAASLLNGVPPDHWISVVDIHS